MTFNNFDNQITVLDQDALDSTVSSVKGYVLGKVPTCMAIAEDPSNNIPSYLHQYRQAVGKTEIEDIFSPTNIVKQVQLAVQSTPMFSSYKTYRELSTNKNDSDLFKVNANGDFASQSDLLDSVGKINTNWSSSELKTWLFSTSYHTPENLLHAIVRTQVYRPLFFNDLDYSKFTENESAYWCETERHFNNVEGED